MNKRQIYTYSSFLAGKLTHINIICQEEMDVFWLMSSSLNHLNFQSFFTISLGKLYNFLFTLSMFVLQYLFKIYLIIINFSNLPWRKDWNVFIILLTDVYVQKTPVGGKYVKLTCTPSCPQSDPHTAYRWYWNKHRYRYSGNHFTFPNQADDGFYCAAIGHEDLLSAEVCEYEPANNTVLDCQICF